jgi:LysR family transcriptional regulator, glycine cleavage system transcriptional activator
MARLPAFDSLYVFAVAARHLSFTAAGNELHRTQSAVSHRIKALENEIGVPLFERLARGLELTSAGAALAHRLNEAIADISRTIAELDRAGEPRQLRVTMLPSVASRWLMPRLSRFCQLHPDVHVQIVADPRVIDLRAERIDLAIRFGPGQYRGFESTPFMSDRMLPVCSPQLLEQRDRITSVDELTRLPLLHDSGAEGDGGSLSDWRSWLDQLGRRDLPCRTGQRFSHAGLAIEAAVLGLGVAMARLSLVADHLTNGTLVCPLPLTTATAFSYYLVAPPARASAPDIAVFSEWLHTEAKEVATVAARLAAHEAEFRATLASTSAAAQSAD